MGMGTLCTGKIAPKNGHGAALHMVPTPKLRHIDLIRGSFIHTCALQCGPWFVPSLL